MLNVTLTNNNNALHKYTRSHAQWSSFLLVVCIFRYNYFFFSVARRLLYFHSVSFAVECTIFSPYVCLCLCVFECTIFVHKVSWCMPHLVYKMRDIHCHFSLGLCRCVWVCAMFMLACVFYCHCSSVIVSKYVCNATLMCAVFFFLEQTRFAHFNFVTYFVSFRFHWLHIAMNRCAAIEKLQLQMSSW